MRCSQASGPGQPLRASSLPFKACSPSESTQAARVRSRGSSLCVCSESRQHRVSTGSSLALGAGCVIP